MKSKVCQHGYIYCTCEEQYRTKERKFLEVSLNILNNSKIKRLSQLEKRLLEQRSIDIAKDFSTS